MLRSLCVSPKGGRPLAFRVHVPPNLAMCVARGAVPVRLEAVVGGQGMPPERLDRGVTWCLEGPHFLVALLVEHWCAGRLHGLLELTPARLRELLTPLEGSAAVFWANRPGEALSWTDGVLPGVHEHLDISEVQEPPKTVPLPKKVAVPRKARGDTAGEAMEVDGSCHFLSIQLPSRESAAYAEALALVKEQGFRLDPSSRRWWLRDRHKTLAFLASFWQVLEGRLGARFTENFRQRTQGLKRVGVRAEAVEVAGGGHVLSVALEAPGVAEDALRRSLATGVPYVETPSGVWLVGRAEVEQLAAAQRAVSGEATMAAQPRFSRRLGGAEIAAVDGELESLSVNFQAASSWRAKARALRHLEELEAAPLSEAAQQVLRGYQKVGVSWMWHLARQGLGGVLADEMGLGKTAQALVLLECLARAEEGLFLVVCPAALLENWRREAARFAPGLKVYVHHGVARREAAASAEGLWITSYGTLARDAAMFARRSFVCAVADEAQHVKNRRSQNARALRGVRARVRLALTGTPIENSMDDLVSLFEFLLPGYLPTASRGQGTQERREQGERVRKLAAPYILRRAKKDVAPELPEKIEQTVFCPMGEEQEQLYRSLEREAREALGALTLKGTSESVLRVEAFTRLLRLRQVCAEPRLLEKNLGPGDSCKLRVFGELLEEALDGGHRMLVFSSFVSVLEFVREDLEARGVRYGWIDGQTRNRQGVCDAFNGDAGITACLISLKAGGTGLNLTGADMVVHYDPWWNPAAEAQATDRAHRIGQQRVVTSVRLIASGTVEERVAAMQREKAALLGALFEESRSALESVGIGAWQELLGWQGAEKALD